MLDTKLGFQIQIPLIPQVIKILKSG